MKNERSDAVPAEGQSGATARRILILFAHPALEKSRVQRRMARAVNALDGVTVHDLYECYPDLHILVEEEQRLVEEHDVIVMQHPLFWYSTPAILKEWQDLVLEHDWAYGSNATALRGKLFMNAISSGGGEDSYQNGGYNRFTIRELLAPLEQTAYLCGMDFLPPFMVYGTHRMAVKDFEPYIAEYRRVILGLRDDTLDIDRARQLPHINADLSAILPEASHAR